MLWKGKAILVESQGIGMVDFTDANRAVRSKLAAPPNRGDDDYDHQQSEDKHVPFPRRELPAV
jgi:hypothetical protein